MAVKSSRKPAGKKSATATISVPLPKGAVAVAKRSAATKSVSQPKSAAKGARAITKSVDHKEVTPREAADLVDAQLASYRGMRDFAVTAEPAGSRASARKPKASAKHGDKAAQTGLPFVIQKHAASHLHYDFRLAWSGVLKSWAVAKGPSYVVSDRRLAVQVEDHPIEYGGFEGIIPKGQYGGGTVMVWDQGTWWPQPGHEDVEAGLRNGALKFELQGSKLQGKWTLVQMHSTRRSGDAGGRWKPSDKPQWLLIKEHDSFERPSTATPVVEEAPNSALTGRTMEQIAAQGDHVWNSRETANAGGTAWFRQDSPATEPRPRSVSTPGRLPGTLPVALLGVLDDLPREPQPEFIQPQLAQETEQPPEVPGWLHELKLDGYRMQARKSARGVQMLTRSGLDWTYRVPAVADAVAALACEACTLDGEVVVLAEDGTTSFAALQASFQHQEQHPLSFFCFDLLHLEGRNTRNLPLGERKAMLTALLAAQTPEEAVVLRLSEHLETSGRLMFEQACRLHAEGIISKRAADPYQPGKRASWLKSKCLHEQEFVIGGFAASADGPDRIGSLLLGYHDPERPGTLHFAGRTGTGFTQRQRQDLHARLAPLAVARAPFARVPTEQRRDVTWVEPVLVAQVRFASWTADGLVRQAAFLGLREDKPAAEVFRERPGTQPRPKTSTGAPTPDSTSQASARPARPLPERSPSSVPPPIRLTHPQKVLDPASGLTKQQLADFYWQIAPAMLPYIAGRPLSLVRCPEGAGKPCFYQKHVNSMLPPGIGSMMVADKKGGAPEPYLTLNTPEALAGLAQIGVLEIHPWSACNAALECPDRLIFDLDPDEELPWHLVAEAADEVRTRLKSAGLKSFLKVTGGKGLHVAAPILPEHDFGTVKDLAHRFVLGMERANPRLYLSKMTKSARKGRIYLDYLRNERGATAVAPFSPRARAGVPVSLPLHWKELADAALPRFPANEFAAWRTRLQQDPWKGFHTLRQSLDPNLFR